MILFLSAIINFIPEDINRLLTFWVPVKSGE